MADPRYDRTEKPPRASGTEPSRGKGSVALAICGEPAVGEALVLLLQSSRYDPRFLPISSLSKPGVLEGVRLVMLVSTLTEWSCNSFLVSLRERLGGIAGIAVLELVPPASAEASEEETLPGSWSVAPWPCSIEELKRQIEAALFAV